LIFVGLIGALGALIDATIGSAYYDLHDALNCLAVAAFGVVVRFVAPYFMRITHEAIREAFK